MGRFEKNEKWAIIHFGGADAIVVIDEKNPEKFYWSGSSSWCIFADDTYIVEELGTFNNEKDYKKIDDLFIYFYKNFNVPEQYNSQSSGWLSPDGKFYPCDYYQHDSFARSLAAIYYISLEGTKALELCGWIRIYDDGNVGHLEINPTQKQIDTVQDILSGPKNPDERYYENLKDSLRYLLQ